MSHDEKESKTDKLETLIRRTIQKAMCYEKKRLGFPTVGDLYPEVMYLNNSASPFLSGKDNYHAHTKGIEKQLIIKLAHVFGLSKGETFGYVTTGGTESNFVSLWWAKKYLHQKNRKKIKLFCSSQSHSTIIKSCEMLEIEVIEVSSIKSTGIDLIELGAKLKKHCHPTTDGVIVVVNIGTGSDGVIDDIVRVKNTLVAQLGHDKIPHFLHADGAIYGTLFPLISPSVSNHLFDYVDSYATSSHKFIGTLRIGGYVLTKRKFIEDAFGKSLEDIAYPTFSDSRDGNTVIELYRLLEEKFDYFSQDKMVLKKIFKRCLDNAIYIEESLRSLMKTKISRNYLTINFPRPTNKAKAAQLGSKYSLMAINELEFSMIVFPQIHRKLLEKFIVDFKSCI